MKYPDFLDKLNDEFIGIDEKLYKIKVDLIPFDKYDLYTKAKLSLLLEADPIAQASLDILGIKGQDSRLEKFGLCRFGGFDDKADIKDGFTTYEYYNCGQRGKCPVEGKLCKHIKVKNGYLTPREIEFMKFITKDLTDKEIAYKMNISYTTAITHRKHIQHKIGCNSKVGICRFAIEKNII